MKRIVSILAVAVCLLTVCLVTWSLDRPAVADPVTECNCRTWCPLFCPPGTECVCGGICGCCECSAPYTPSEPETPEQAFAAFEAEAPSVDAAEETVGADVAQPGRPCKPCKDRPWCECTYNGHPRISCDPCCYDAQPYPICYD